MSEARRSAIMRTCKVTKNTKKCALCMKRWQVNESAIKLRSSEDFLICKKCVDHMSALLKGGMKK